MRGAERPARVKWSQPFFPPLKPLSASASRQIFIEVAEEPAKEEESALDELLGLSGSLPLAVSLMANIASLEGYSGALSRWHEENTTLLSDGHNKSSNLEKSIILSLNSPRISSSPHAKDLLFLLSLLPDGITVKDLIASQVPIPQVAHCASVIVQTSLAYMDTGGRIRSLVPVREYIRRVHPPSIALSRPLRTHLEHLVSVWNTHRELASNHLTSVIMASFGNINELTLQGLSDEASLPGIIDSIFTLIHLSNVMLRGPSPFMEKLWELAEVNNVPWLKWRRRCHQLYGDNLSGQRLLNGEVWIKEGAEYFRTVHCSITEGISIPPDLYSALKISPST